MGGLTVAEAKRRMSYREFVAWARFVRQRGPLSDGVRVEHSVALMAAQFANGFLKKQNGQKFTLDDFMVYAAKAEQQTELDPQAVFALLKSVAVKDGD